MTTSTRPRYAEAAPSQLREEEPTLSRVFGGVGWCAALVGTVVVLANLYFKEPRFFPEWFGWVLILFGLVGVFAHAASESDSFLRLMVGGAGLLLMVGGVGLAIAKLPKWGVGLAPFLPGYVLLILFARRSGDDLLGAIAVVLVGVLGAIASIAGMFPMAFSASWVEGPGLVLSLLGMISVAVYLTLIEDSAHLQRLIRRMLSAVGLTKLDGWQGRFVEDWASGRMFAFAIGGLGLLAFAIGFLRSTVPTLLHDWRDPTPRYAMPMLVIGVVALAIGIVLRFVVSAKDESGESTRSIGRVALLVGLIVALTGGARLIATSAFRGLSLGAELPKPFLIPSGFALMTLGLVFAAISVGFWSDNRLVVMIRREFSAFFVSPIAYIVMFGFTILGGLSYYLFIIQLIRQAEIGRPAEEPIVRDYIISFLPVVAVMVAVPLLTMRLFSEEKRTGTMEVLLTAPISEWMIVVSKFVGAWAFFLLLWTPWALFLLAMRLETGQAFDYRPMIGMGVALAATAASFVAMGVFFSSLTNNQIIAAVLTFAGMMMLVAAFFLGGFVLTKTDGLIGAVKAVAKTASFIDMWNESMLGKLALKDVVYHFSAAVFWLFMTVKVLEARRWS